jgi:hypothetical protein
MSRERGGGEMQTLSPCHAKPALNSVYQKPTDVGDKIVKGMNTVQGCVSKMYKNSEAEINFHKQ